MGEIKFNHTSLLDCKTKIDYVVRELQKNADEAMAQISGFEPEKQHWLMQSLNGIIASIEEMQIMSKKLAKLADLYGGCERAVENIVRRLCVPVPFSPRQSASSTSTPFTTEYSVSYTMPKDLFVESWIMELMYSEAFLAE